jgi:hypothetical protein
MTTKQIAAAQTTECHCAACAGTDKPETRFLGDWIRFEFMTATGWHVIHVPPKASERTWDDLVAQGAQYIRADDAGCYATAA